MRHEIKTQVERTARHRQEAVRALAEAKAQYEVSVLDHVTARIRSAVPEATHVTFDRLPGKPSVLLRAVWGGGLRGGERRLITDGESDCPIRLGELSEELMTTLTGPASAAWSAVRPEPVDGRWVLDLPPFDRAERIAELAREHYPTAELLKIDFREPAAPRVVMVGIIDNLIAYEVTAAEDEILWPAETERAVSTLVRQIAALPRLQAMHLTRVGGPGDRTALLSLPGGLPEEEGMS
jgi:hypothetical protein